MFVAGNLVRVSYRDGRTGQVLAINDPRAWPTQESVDAHLADRPVDGARTPVLWDFGRVYWEPTSELIGEYGPNNEVMRGQRVELHPGCDLWMAGAKYGTVIERTRQGYRVKLDATARAATIPADLLRVIR